MAESVDDERLRFQLDLEFVQCLANPSYLNYLAQTGYFADEAFINYLDHLQYWKRPEYACSIVFPHCLYFLDLLQDEHFRQAIAHSETAAFLHQKQHWHWQWHRNKPISSERPEI